jgi:hypothetical protein
VGRFALFLALAVAGAREVRSWLEDYGIGLVVSGLGLAWPGRAGPGLKFGVSGLLRCLTILSEERETWAAVSLRDVVAGRTLA